MTGAEAATSQRVDKWLWQARFFKTRTLAARTVSEGKVRVNGTRISKPARPIAPGDTLTFPQGRAVRLIRILAVGVRRGPASEAQTLYDDLDPPDTSLHKEQAPKGPHFQGKGRPTKRDRRAIDLNRRTHLE